MKYYLTGDVGLYDRTYISPHLKNIIIFLTLKTVNEKYINKLLL